jgi:hypothetical protein
MLGAQYIPGIYRDNPNTLAVATTFLGQELFNPPDVAGWRLNLGWINTAMMLNRYTWADIVAIGRPTGQDPPGVYLSADRLKKYTKGSAKKTVRKFLSILGPIKTDSDMEKKLEDYLQTDPAGNPVTFVKNSRTIDSKVRGLVHLIMCLSEFELN